MFSRFLRVFFWSILVAFVLVCVYLGVVRASAQEAILVEDFFKGYQEDVVRPGGIRFLPSRMMPGRIKLHPVRIKDRILDVNFTFPLSQSEVLGLDEAFSIQTGARIGYNLDPAKISYLFRRVKDKEWKNLDEYVEKRLNFFLGNLIADFYQTDEDLPKLESRIQNYFNESFIENVNKEFFREGIIVETILLERLYVPDLERYRAMVAAADSILEQKIGRIASIDKAKSQRDAEQITDRAYFARLEKIGKLMDKYPHLREYLAIDRLSKNVEVMVMPYEHWFGPSNQEQISRLLRKDDSEKLRDRGDLETQSLQSSPPPQVVKNKGIELKDLTPP